MWFQRTEVADGQPGVFGDSWTLLGWYDRWEGTNLFRI